MKTVGATTYGYRRTIRVSPNLSFTVVPDAEDRMRRLQEALRQYDEWKHAKEAGADL